MHLCAVFASLFKAVPDQPRATSSSTDTGRGDEKAEQYRYTYVTSVYANAGLMAVRYVHWGKMFLELCSVGPFRCFAYPDRYQIEQKGRMSRDGERGAVWSINTLAPYILVRSLSLCRTLYNPICP